MLCNKFCGLKSSIVIDRILSEICKKLYMAKTVLITGGTGMIGRRLTELLLEKGFKVSYLSRQKENITGVKVYRWDISKKYIEDGALETADYIVSLAGAGIADERWTEKRKKEIIESRTKGIELIANELQSRAYNVKACVCASGIGFYGADTGNEHLDEEAVSGTDFIAHVSRQWEKSSELFENIKIRTTILRIGVVLSEKGGALPKIAAPIRFGAGSAIGSGKQWLSWIHLDDLCGMIIAAIENEKWKGIYNAVSPNPVTNSDFTRQIAKVLNRPLLLPNVPSFVLKMALGELADLVIGGNYVLNQKILDKTDFQYKFDTLFPALTNLLKKST